MNKQILLLIASSLISMTMSCSCIMPLPVQESFANTDVVFLGSVIGIKTVEFQTTVTFMVHKTYKGLGKKTDQVVVNTGSDSAMCGYYFELNKSYLVYASKYDKTINVSLCSRTSLLTDAARDLKVLNK
jgi:hypothetical protein